MSDDTVYKFDQDGKPLPYYGTTIISFLNSKDMEIYREALLVSEHMKASGFSGNMAFLPPSSFHMTVLTLCREIDRQTPFWPLGIPKNAGVPQIDRILKERVKTLPPMEEVIMEVDACEEKRIALKPFDKNSQRILEEYRDQVSETTGIRHSTHDGFRFHLSLAYGIRPLSESQRKESHDLCQSLTRRLKEKVPPFKLPGPEFVIFNDMTHYDGNLACRVVCS